MFLSNFRRGEESRTAAEVRADQEPARRTASAARMARRGASGIREVIPARTRRGW